MIVFWHSFLYLLINYSLVRCRLDNLKNGITSKISKTLQTEHLVGLVNSGGSTFDVHSDLNEYVTKIGQTLRYMSQKINSEVRWIEEEIAKQTFNPKFEEFNVSVKLLRDSDVGNIPSESTCKNPVLMNQARTHWPVEVYSEVDKTNAWAQALDYTFKAANLPFKMYFATATGMLKLYPSFSWDKKETDLFDIRHRSWFQSGSQVPKRLLVMLDTTGSMTGQLLGLANVSAQKLVQSLNIDDYFAIAHFPHSHKQEPHIVTDQNGTYDHCFDTFARATKLNRMRAFKALESLKSTNHTPFDSAFRWAFDLFTNFTTDFDGNSSVPENCNELMVVITDSAFEYDSELLSVLATKPASLRIMVYALDEPVRKPDEHVHAVCKFGTFYRPVPSGSAVSNILDNFLNLSASVFYGPNHSPLLTSDLILHPASDIYQSSDYTGNGFMLSLSQNVYNKTTDLTFVGLLGMELSIDQLLEELPNQKLSPLGYAFVINENGFLAYHPGMQIMTDVYDDPGFFEWLELEFDYRDEKHKLLNEFVSGAKGSRKIKEFIRVADFYHTYPSERLYTYAPVEKTQFEVVFVTPTQTTSFREVKDPGSIGEDQLSRLLGKTRSFVASETLKWSFDSLPDLSNEELLPEIEEELEPPITESPDEINSTLATDASDELDFGRQFIGGTDYISEHLPETEANEQTLSGTDSNNQILSEIESTNQPFVDTRPTDQTLLDPETSNKLVPESEITSQLLLDIESTTQSITESDSSIQAISNIESTDRPIPDIESTLDNHSFRSRRAVRSMYDESSATTCAPDQENCDTQASLSSTISPDELHSIGVETSHISSSYSSDVTTTNSYSSETSDNSLDASHLPVPEVDVSLDQDTSPSTSPTPSCIGLDCEATDTGSSDFSTMENSYPNEVSDDSSTSSSDPEVNVSLDQITPQSTSSTSPCIGPNCKTEESDSFDLVTTEDPYSKQGSDVSIPSSSPHSQVDDSLDQNFTTAPLLCVGPDCKSDVVTDSPDESPTPLFTTDPTMADNSTELHHVDFTDEPPMVANFSDFLQRTVKCNAKSENVLRILADASLVESYLASVNVDSISDPDVVSGTVAFASGLAFTIPSSSKEAFENELVRRPISPIFQRVFDSGNLIFWIPIVEEAETRKLLDSINSTASNMTKTPIVDDQSFGDESTDESVNVSVKSQPIKRISVFAPIEGAGKVPLGVQGITLAPAYMSDQLRQDPECSNSDSKVCYLLEDAANIVATTHSLGSVLIGHFLGSVDPPLMRALLSNGVYDWVKDYNLQATCRTLRKKTSPIASDSSSLRTSILSPAWLSIAAATISLFDSSGFTLLTAWLPSVSASSMQSNEYYIEYPCIQLTYRYYSTVGDNVPIYYNYYRGPEKTTPSLQGSFNCYSNCTRSWAVKPLEGTNLMLVVVDKPCQSCIQLDQPVFRGPKQDNGPDVCRKARRQRYARKSVKCGAKAGDDFCTWSSANRVRTTVILLISTLILVLLV